MANTQLGSKNSHAVLNEDDVRLIKALIREGLKSGDIAIKFEVAASTIRNIKAGSSWCHVK